MKEMQDDKQGCEELVRSVEETTRVVLSVMCAHERVTDDKLENALRDFSK